MKRNSNLKTDPKAGSRAFWGRAPYCAVALATYAAASLPFMAMAAEGDATQLLGTIIKIICSLITALAVVLAILGIVHYASAHSEGDGPAKQKAIMQLAAGVMLMVLSMILNGNAETLAGMMATSL